MRFPVQVSDTVHDPNIFTRSTAILRSLYGPDASFRDGQYEAIKATMTQNRTLVVQRTGWGKSLVYFVCTKLMREQNRGVTMVVGRRRSGCKPFDRKGESVRQVDGDLACIL